MTPPAPRTPSFTRGEIQDALAALNYFMDRQDEHTEDLASFTTKLKALLTQT